MIAPRRLGTCTLLTVGLALCLALMLSNDASALTIDDFENEEFSMTDTTVSGILRTTQSGVAGVLGGSRESFVSYAPAPGGPGTTLAVAGGLALATAGSGSSGGHGFVYDGLANSATDGSGGALGADLSALDRFVVEVVAVVKVDGQVDVTVALNDSDSFSVAPVVATSVGLLEIPFASFSGIDFSDIRSITLTTNGTVGANESLSIGSFIAVPEPTTALLLLAGLLGIALRQRA